MIARTVAIICRLKEAEKLEICWSRVALWTLIFTNAYFVSYLISMLIKSA